MRSKVSRNTVIPLAAALTVFGLGAIAVWLIAAQQLHAVLSDQKNYVVQKISLEFRHRDELLQDFAERANQGCSDKLLEEMRRALFDHNSTRDIAILDDGANEIRCTALLGALERPALLQPEAGLPTPKEGRIVWMNPAGLDYPHSTNLVVFREGPLAVISYPAWTGDLPDYRRWEVTATTPNSGTKVTVLGQSGVSGDYQWSRWNPFVSLLYVRSCELENGIICLYLNAGLGELAANEWPLLVTGNLVNATMAVLLFLQVRTHLLLRNSVGSRIRRSIRSGGVQFRCVYQPIIDLRSDRLSGCEVLARYEDEYGPLSPAEFIPEVERQQLTWAFTEIVLSRALKDLEPILDRHPELNVSVNFFPGDLDDVHVERLSTNPSLRWAASRKFRLCFEILETGILSADHMQKVQRFLDRCGFLTAIDDFGTGYSNISQVRDSHINLIKIDRSFVQELDRKLPAMRASLVGPMIEIARSINVEVVAEGIETETQLSQIKELKVRFGQGFFLSRPLETDAFRDFAQADRNNAPQTVVSMKRS
ncbi:EAL domain-containing protein [Roseibium marinum]|uniref:cyclic-guanylate-specific phosphodiesterase n=1 Tax=Roseibium marinum TaxID=281252 RepID=A0A2S3ULG2_9HYPH|nr:EAL domain-containing protein [Roseibium marinum]POF28393.1 sensor c-di-GMP phosphodiesterase-like protein [Roseibium marinum]